MEILISNGEVKIIQNSKRNSYYRKGKGNSLLQFANDFTVVDLETTGLDPTYDSIIEIGAVKVRDNKIVSTFNSLVKPNYEIDEYITELTGITNEMLEKAPNIDTVLPNFLKYVEDDIIIGHNVSFDINFIYDNKYRLFNQPFSNSYADTMRLSRILLPDMPHHRLKDLIKLFNITVSKQHRALEDSQSTLKCYFHLKQIAIEQFGSVDLFSESHKQKHSKKKLDLKTITTSAVTFDESNPFFGKVCVFTGALEKLKRADAAQLVVNLGGICGNSVTKKTNYLILGNNDYCPTIKDGKSSKQKKAEELKLKGNDIEIISENVFYDMLNI